MIIIGRRLTNRTEGQILMSHRVPALPGNTDECGSKSRLRILFAAAQMESFVYDGTRKSNSYGT